MDQRLIEGVEVTREEVFFKLFSVQLKINRCNNWMINFSRPNYNALTSVNDFVQVHCPHKTARIAIRQY